MKAKPGRPRKPDAPKIAKPIYKRLTREETAHLRQLVLLYDEARFEKARAFMRVKILALDPNYFKGKADEEEIDADIS